MRTVFRLVADCIDLLAEAVAALGIAVGGTPRPDRDAPRAVEPPVGAASGDAARGEAARGEAAGTSR